MCGANATPFPTFCGVDATPARVPTLTHSPAPAHLPSVQWGAPLSETQEQLASLRAQVDAFQSTESYQVGFRDGLESSFTKLQRILNLPGEKKFVTVGMQALMDQSASLAMQLHQTLSINRAKMDCGHPQGALQEVFDPTQGMVMQCSVCAAIAGAVRAEKAKVVQELGEFIESPAMWSIAERIFGVQPDFTLGQLLTQLRREMTKELLPETPAPSIEEVY